MSCGLRTILRCVAALAIAFLGQPAVAQDPNCSGQYLKADVTGDGLPDLVHVYPDASRRPAYWLWAGLPGGGFASSPTHGFYDLSAGSGAPFQGSYFLGDINGDGLADLVNVYSSNGRVAYWAWLAQPGTGFATSPSHGYYDLGVAWTGTVLLGDINGDGRADLVQVHSSAGRTAYWAWLASPGTGFSTAISHGYLDLGSGYDGTYLLGDINGDGMADLVQAYGYAGNVAYWAWLAQPGAGFSTSISHGYLNLGAAWGGSFLLADSNADGIADLVQVTGSGGAMTHSAWRGVPGAGFATTVSQSWSAMAPAHNFVRNGNLIQWTGYDGPVTWSNINRATADGWNVGAGAGGTVTATWMNSPIYLQLAWTVAPTSGEGQHAPAFRFTMLEHHNLGGVADAHLLAGENVVVSFYARVAAGSINLTPILWQSYNLSSAIKGDGYELFESSGVPGAVAVAQGEPNPNANCVVTTTWQKCEKVITLPQTCDKPVWGTSYTGAGIDFPARYGPVLEIADFRVQPEAKARAFMTFQP